MKVVSPIIFRGKFIHPGGSIHPHGGCLGFHPSTETLPTVQLIISNVSNPAGGHPLPSQAQRFRKTHPRRCTTTHTTHEHMKLIRIYNHGYVYIHSSDTGIYHVIHKKQKSPKYLVQDAMHPLMLPPLPLLHNRRPLARHPSRPHGGCWAPAGKKGGQKVRHGFGKKCFQIGSCKIPGWGVFSFQQCGIGSLFNVAWSFLGETARSYLLIEILRAVVFRRILLLFRRLGTEKCECLPQEFVAIGYRKCIIIIIIIIIIMLSQSLSISILHHWHNIFNP